MKPHLFCVAIALMLQPWIPGLARAEEPTTARGFYERGSLRERDKQFDLALADLTKAIELDSEFTPAYFSRSSIYSGRPELEKRDYAKAVADLTKMLKLEPNNFSARFNRALFHEYLREYNKAIVDYSHVIDGDTDFSMHAGGKAACLAHTHHYRGRALLWYKKDYAEAVADFDEALRLDPKIESVNAWRAQAHYELKQFAKSHKDFALAVERDPNDSISLHSWAWQLATCPDEEFRDGKKALEFARKLVEKSRESNPHGLNTLAAALAEVGQFDEAIKAQRKAIDSLKPKAIEQIKDYRERLKLYEAGKAFRTK